MRSKRIGGRLRAVALLALPLWGCTGTPRARTPDAEPQTSVAAIARAKTRLDVIMSIILHHFVSTSRPLLTGSLYQSSARMTPGVLAAASAHPSGCLFLFGLGQRQGDPEARAHALLRVHRKLAEMLLDQLFGCRQSKPRPKALCRK